MATDGHYRTGRPCKKLNTLHHKYTVTKVISPHVLEFNVSTAIYPRFHVDQVKRAGTEPTARQIMDDRQPPPIQDEDAKWLVDSILCARWKKVGVADGASALLSSRATMCQPGNLWRAWKIPLRWMTSNASTDQRWRTMAPSIPTR